MKKDQIEIVEKVPFLIQLIAIKYKIVDYKKEYNCDKTINLAKGEIYKPNKDPDKWYDGHIGTSVSGSYWNNEECTTRSIYLGQGWFKLVSRVK